MPRDTIAFANWSVQQRGEYWYYGRTFSDDAKNFKGPYSSLTSVTLMIARELVREAYRRRARLNPAE